MKVQEPVPHDYAANPAARTVVLVAVFAAMLYAPGQSIAQIRPGGPGLTPLTYQNGVETAAARANQAAFGVLETACNGDGRFDQNPNPQFSQVDPSNGCTQEAFAIYLTTRELVHTANEIQGSGPTVASLGLDLEGLGLALRWTAAEEFAAQASMATDFANGQLTNLAARMSALRFGARGFSLGAFHVEPGENARVAGLQRRRGGGASADSERETYSPWGGFINGAFGWGSKEPTPLEDAFDFDGQELTVGVDYRFKNNFILGGIVGYTEQTVDFDAAASAISVVDGGIDADGVSYIGFALFQGERFSFSASLGYQALDYDAVRRIKYPSFNPNLTSVNATTTSRPESTVVMGTLNVAYAFQARRLTIEPFINVEYVDVEIEQFTENRSTNSLSSTNSRNFSLVVGEQSIQSLDSSIGIKLQLTLTPKFAVIVPYVSYEAHSESQDEARSISARYVGLDVLNPSGFQVLTDRPDSSYSRGIAGLSMVLRGGRQRQAGGAIYGGLQGFVQYTRISGLENYEDQVISGGLRYEF